MKRAYCPPCRAYFATTANPPYGALHAVIKTDESEEVVHMHPITREVLRPALSEAEEALIARPEVQAAVLFDLEARVGALMEEDKYLFSRKASTWTDSVRKSLAFLREAVQG